MDDFYILKDDGHPDWDQMAVRARQDEAERRADPRWATAVEMANSALLSAPEIRIDSNGVPFKCLVVDISDQEHWVDVKLLEFAVDKTDFVAQEIISFMRFLDK